MSISDNRSNKQAKTIFLEALEIEVDAERRAFIQARCGDDETLRREVERLLAHQGDVGSFLESPPPGLDHGVSPTIDLKQSERTGELIGPYKLLERPGAGGMGVVWAAERKEPIRQKVAIKVIKPGMDSEQVIARFEAERAALALMDHPNIARVLDAGATEQGRPYFVMELIRGVPITEYCDGKRLPVRQRLQLFMSVCKAVQHAHQKGVIHRDIKPSNVLVTEHDGKPIPKVIDFGVAKALHQPLTERSLCSGVFQAIGTLAYMSPEQAGLSASDVDTRADVYGLGVLLYELLTGSTPFEKDELSSAAFDEACRLIREKEPPKPSTRISTLGDRAKTISRDRGVDPNGLGKLVRGELDWVVAKSIEKDRNRRYVTADALAADIARHLADEPVEAGPPSIVYRARKYLNRNKGPVTAATLVGASIVLGLIAALTGWSVASHQRDAARDTEYRANQHLKELRVELLGSALKLANTALADNDSGEAKRHLARHIPRDGESDLRGFDWRVLWRQCAEQSFHTLRTEDHANAVSISPDGNTLAATDIRGRVTLWDLATFRRIDQFHTHEMALYYTPVRFSPRGGGVLAFLGSDVRTVQLLNYQTRQVVTLTGHTLQVTDVTFSPDGSQVITCSLDGTCRVWDATTGDEQPGATTESELWSIAVSPDGKTLAAGDNDGRIHQWNLSDMSLKDVLHCTMLKTQVGVYLNEGNRIWELAFSPNGQQLVAAAGDCTVKFWDLVEREQVVLAGHADQVRGVAFAQEGKVIVSGGRDGAVRLWDASNQREIGVLKGHTSAVQHLTVHGDLLATAGGDSSVRLWRLSDDDPDEVYLLDDYVLDLAFTSVGDLFLLRGAPFAGTTPQYINTRVSFVDIQRESLKPVDINLGSGLPTSISVSAQQILAVGMHDGRVLLLNALTKESRGELPQVHQGEVLSLAFSPNGSKLAVGDSLGVVRLWDVTGAPKLLMEDATVHSAPVRRLTLGPDDLVTGDADGVVARWDVAETRFDEKLSTAGAAITDLALNSSTRLLAIARFGGEVTTVNLADTTRPKHHKVDSYLASGVCFIDEGKTLVSTAWDGRIRFWNVPDLRMRVAFAQKQSRIRCVDMSPDGNVLATGGARFLRLWRGSSPDVSAVPTR